MGHLSTQDLETGSAKVIVPVMILVGHADRQLLPDPDTQPDRQVPL